MTKKFRTLPNAAGLGLALLLVIPVGGQAAAADDYGYDDTTTAPIEGYDTGYSYFKEIEGSATLFQGQDGEREDAEINRPILSGDRVYTTPQSRLEVILSDNNVLRIDGDTEVVFESLAYSPESTDTSTSLRLLQGNVQLVVLDGAPGDELPRVYTSNATVFTQRAGVYRITAGRSQWSSVVVREGFAEVASDDGSVIARSGDEASVEGGQRPRVDVVAAGGLDGLERWGEALEQALPEDGYVDDSLRYAAAPLEDHGTWVQVNGRAGWRPYYDDGWRPYWKGRWVYTPAGMTWVSYEPWGWVPYHYGTWDYAAGYGWVWFPGSRFAPAYVHWYWGDGYAAWVPSGFYVNFYSGRYGSRFGVGFGVYGWAGGRWDPFYDWNFCSVAYLGYRRQYDYVTTGRALHHRVGWREVPRGIITTDTRGLTPRHWRRHEEVEEVLVERGGGHGRNLPDVTSYVAREPELPREVQRRVAVLEAPATERSRRNVGTRTDDRRADAGNGAVAGNNGRSRGTGTLRPSEERNAAAPRATTSGRSDTARNSTGRVDAGRTNTERNDSGRIDSGRREPSAQPPVSRPRTEVERPTRVTPRTPAYPERGRVDTRSPRRADEGVGTTARDSNRGSVEERATPRTSRPTTTPSERRGSSPTTVDGRSDRGRSGASTRSSSPPSRTEGPREGVSRRSPQTVRPSSPPPSSSSTRSSTSPRERSSARAGSSNESSRSSAGAAREGSSSSARGSSTRSGSASAGSANDGSAARSRASEGRSSSSRKSSEGNRSRSSRRAQGGQSGGNGGGR